MMLLILVALFEFGVIIITLNFCCRHYELFCLIKLLILLNLKVDWIWFTLLCSASIVFWNSLSGMPGLYELSARVDMALAMWL